MNRSVLFALTAVSLLGRQAFADEKSDAILKEVRLRAANLKTYSVTVRSPKDDSYMRVFLARPNRLRIELVEGKGQNVLIVLNGASALVEENGKAEVVPASSVESEVTKIRNFALGHVEDLIGKITKTTYITQKMLDETTVVDVIDVLGTMEGKSARLYIDNNGQIRKAVGKTLNKTPGVLIFENPVIDEPIPDEKFAIPKSK